MTPQQTDSIRGHCACSALSFSLLKAPMYVHCCHCQDCQRETGSAFAINALIETDAIRLTAGRIEVITIPTASGKGQQRCECPSCHTVIYSHYTGLGPEIAFVRVGTLLQPDRIEPDIHIFTASRQPWVVIPDHLPSSTAYYRFRDVWPQASLDRRRKALAGT